MVFIATTLQYYGCYLGEDGSGFFTAFVVITNKDSLRRNQRLINLQQRSNDNREKRKNEAKKVFRRDQKINALQDTINALVHDSSSSRYRRADLVEDLKRSQKQVTSLATELKQIKISNELLQSAEDSAREKFELTREILTANRGGKSSKHNSYSLDFKSKIVCTLSLTFSSIRALTRTLRCLRETGLIKEGILPCANTIINWAMQAGLGKLNKIEKSNEDFMLIVDHWIGKGSQKIFAALRILKSDYEKAIQEKRALKLSDIELVGLKIMRHANAQANCQYLHDLCEKIGDPVSIISDRASDLRSSVTLYNALYNKEICHISDYSHYAANALKLKYDKLEWFQEFLQNASTGSNKIRQTEQRAFESPVLRVKARFMNLSKHAMWGLNIIAKVAGPRKSDDKALAKLQEVFGITIKHREQIQEFALTLRIVNLLGKILKKRGLSQKTIALCQKIMTRLPECDVVRKKLNQWFAEQSLILVQLKQKGWIESIPVSSDMVETFFSKLKLLQEIGLNEPSRIILILPLLCGKLTIQRIKANLQNATLRDVDEWLKVNIPETSLKERRRFLGTKRAKNGGASVQNIQLKPRDNLLKTGTG